MTTSSASMSTMSYEDALSTSKAVQKHADKYILVGACLMGTCVFGLIGLPIFLYGVWLLKRAEDRGLAVRPAMMTFVGALVLMDGFLNTMGWMIDVFAHHSLIIRIFEMGWSLLLDNGYAWNFNNMWFGGAAAPGEKSWEIACVFILFPIRVVAAWGFLQGKRWGLQWLIMSCWMGVFAWVGYLFNMAVFWEMRFVDIAAPVWGWWLYDIWYITPFVILPYLYTINKEMFSSD
jgi:hypothetical protein